MRPLRLTPSPFAPTAGVDVRQAALLLLVAAAGAATVVSGVDTDSNADLSAGTAAAVRGCFAALSTLTWRLLGALLVVSALHYVAAAAASRSAAGVRLPFRELIAAQMTAAAANRLTPAGLGGAGVIGRFLTRRGGLTPVQATAAVSALAVMGAVADVAAFGLLIGGGLLFGLAGASKEVPLLLSRLTALVPIWSTAARVALIAVALAGLTIAAVPAVRRSRPATRLRDAAIQFAKAVAVLLRHPGRVMALLAASAGTTLALAAGFAAAASLGPTALPPAQFAAIMIGYMVAAAAGNALPTPGGIGAVDGALVAVLLAAGAGAGPAFATVVAFRIVTFWSPAVVGAVLTRRLRRAGVL